MTMSHCDHEACVWLRGRLKRSRAVLVIVVIASLVVAAETDPDENLTQFSHNVSHRDYVVQPWHRRWSGRKTMKENREQMKLWPAMGCTAKTGAVPPTLATTNDDDEKDPDDDCRKMEEEHCPLTLAIVQSRLLSQTSFFRPDLFVRRNHPATRRWSLPIWVKTRANIQCTSNERT